VSVVAEQLTQDEREALVQDAAGQISKLAIQAQLLEPDAKRDPRIQQELEALQSERAAAEAELRELLGADRRERQSADAEAAEAHERQAAHLARAREIGKDRLAAATAVDRALKAFAEALGKHEALSREQANELTWAGSRQAADIARPRGHRINSALVFALRAAGVPARAIELPAAVSAVKPLTESEPVAVEPLAPEA